MPSDAINDLIDQNLQDFINNTTITVNQKYTIITTITTTIDYITNNDYNSTNVDGINDNYNDYWPLITPLDKAIIQPFLHQSIQLISNSL